MGIDFNELKHKAQEQSTKLSQELGKAAETARSKANEHTDKLDKAADFAKSKFGDHSDKIDSAVHKAKDFLGGGKGDGTSGSDSPGQNPKQ